MNSSGRNTKRQTLAVITACTLWALMLALVGCEPARQAARIPPATKHNTAADQDLHAGALTPTQIETLNAINANLAENITPAQPLTSAESEQSPAQLASTRVINAAGVGREPSGGPLYQEPSDSPRYLPNEPKSPPAHVETESSNSLVKLPALSDPAMADQLISVNFDQVDIRVMLKTVGDITGINFVVDEAVQGKVTVMSPTKIRLGDMYEFLESILEVNGCAAVPGPDLVKVVPRAEAVKRNLQVRIGSDPRQIPQSDALVTQIIPLKYADAVEVGQIIKPRLPGTSYMATYSRTNSILITDSSSNIRHISQIIQKLDVPGSEEQVTVIPLKYASAEVLSEQIAGIMKDRKEASPQVLRAGAITALNADVRILPDSRTNSLVVVADAHTTEMVVKLARELDIQRPRGTNNVHVVYLKNATAEETAESLTGALTNLRIAGALDATQQVQVTADEGTNSLIIAASAQDFEVISEIIEKLDIIREQVLVEMLLMEVSEDGLKEIGIDWATLDEAVDGSIRFFGNTNLGPRVDFLSGDLEGLAVGTWIRNDSELSIGSIFYALDKQSAVNILSTPHILTSNHSKARIVVGENRPFAIGERITETDPLTPTVIRTFEYRDVGITLDITPHISQGGMVRLEISTEFTKLIETVTTLSVDTPITAKRQAETVVTMNSGSTVVIGGLIRDDIVTVNKKVPLIADIPLIGELFKFKSDQVQKTNLLIFITPHVMSSQRQMQELTEAKKEQMKPALEQFEQKVKPR